MVYPNDILTKLDMLPEHGLVWLDRKDNPATLSEALAVHQARRFKADAVYFRRDEEAGRSIPQVYIYTRGYTDDDLVEIHTNLWSSGVVPLFYIVTATQVRIFNCTKSVEQEEGKLVSKPMDVLSWVGDIEEETGYSTYSAKHLDNGAFWDEHASLLNAADSPYQRLLDGLLSAKKDLVRQGLPLGLSTINKLLIVGVMVRYLEEKEDDSGVKLLEIGRDLYQKFPDCNSFTDILRQGHILAFLSELDLKFNGKLFDLSKGEREELSRVDLAYVAAIFDADLEPSTRQYVLWPIYAFNHLPIELISGLYEVFLKQDTADPKSGVVYTPPYLVNALIDECMPLDKAKAYFANEDFKVLDPACGSGIFLVAALKRMLEWKAALHFEATGKVAYPGVEAIKRITRNNIFGVDIEEGAGLISIFSLSIALCDKLSPMQIWEELRFDDLGNGNIQTADFFQVYRTLPQGHFDLVIGNPPFNPPEGFNNRAYLNQIKKTYKVEPSRALNDDNLALFFLDRAMALRRDSGTLCFVLPAGAWLYNNNAHAYRSYFMDQFQVRKIFDFTHLSNKLFHRSTNVAVCAIVAASHQSESPDDLLHIVVKRAKAAEERFFFELDHYDFHQVPYQTALTQPWVWKANLLGGGRLLRLLERLGQLRSLGDYLEDMKAQRGWVFGEGYVVGNRSKPAEWITGQKTVQTQSFSEDGCFDYFVETAQRFERPRSTNKAIFRPPHILIKENLGKERIPMVFSEEYLCFKNEIMGIHAPPDDTERLKSLYKHLMDHALNHRFFLFATSSRAGVSRSSFTLLKQDLLRLPYPEEVDDLRLGYSEAIVRDDVLQYQLKAGVSAASSPLNEPVQDNDLRAYGEVFCRILNPIYAQNGQVWFARGYYEEGTAVAFAFCYGKPSPDALPHLFGGGMEGVERLLHQEARRHLRVTRLLRAYLHLDGYDVLLLIKPKYMRYWLKSIALRDADDTFTDLKRTGF